VGKTAVTELLNIPPHANRVVATLAYKISFFFKINIIKIIPLQKLIFWNNFY